MMKGDTKLTCHQRNMQKVNDYYVEYYQRNKELLKEKRLNFSQEKKDKIKAYQKQWRESNKDYMRNYYHIITKDQINKRKEYAGNYQQKLINART